VAQQESLHGYGGNAKLQYSDITKPQYSDSYNAPCILCHNSNSPQCHVFASLRRSNSRAATSLDGRPIAVHESNDKQTKRNETAPRRASTDSLNWHGGRNAQGRWTWHSPKSESVPVVPLFGHLAHRTGAAEGEALPPRPRSHWKSPVALPGAIPPRGAWKRPSRQRVQLTSQDYPTA